MYQMAGCYVQSTHLKRQYGCFNLPLSWETKDITQRKYGQTATTANSYQYNIERSPPFPLCTPSANTMPAIITGATGKTCRQVLGHHCLLQVSFDIPTQQARTVVIWVVTPCIYIIPDYTTYFPTSNNQQ
jgi:hypothetical protein